VRRTNGRSVTVEAIDPIGSPEKPLSDAQFGAKFRDCARNVVRPVSDANVDAAIGCWRRCRTRGSCCRHSPVDGCASTSAYCAIDVSEVCNTATVGAA
jgi:hypothetical protein